MRSKYENYTKQELVQLLLKRDADRKLGLIWERDEIEHERSLNDDFVTLELDENLSAGTSPYRDLLIEGDNFDALRHLHMAYKGRIKCIYIDPPYNTGQEDFIYNDKFVDKEHGYRHSMWLEFMYRRLKLAKDLLASDGVIFVSIGEDEFSNLSVLMDQVFPGMKVGTFVWRRRSGANDNKEWFISVDHEYVICFANKGFSFAGEEKDLSKYTNPDDDPNGPWVSGDLNQAKNFRQRPDAFYPICQPENDIWYLPDPNSVWRFATQERLDGKRKIRTQTMEAVIQNKQVLWPENQEYVTYHSVAEIFEAINEGAAPRNLSIYQQLEVIKEQALQGIIPEKVYDNIPPIDFWIGKKIGFGKPRHKRYSKDLKRNEKPISTWILPSSMKKAELEKIDLSEVEAFSVGFNTEGTSLLSQILGHKEFSYPKPMSLIKSLVKQSTNSNEEHVVLDFFAGSGTTGHAVWELNQEDGGNRRFIMVSSTEATEKEPLKNVCRDVASKRLRLAAEGYSFRTAKGVTKVDGIGGEFAYLRAVRTSMDELQDEIQHDQIWYVLQQIHFDRIVPYVKADGCPTLNRDGLRIVYLPETDERNLNSLRSNLGEQNIQTVIYTWRPAIVRQIFNDANLIVERIPEFLVDRFGGGAS